MGETNTPFREYINMWGRPIRHLENIFIQGGDQYAMQRIYIYRAETTTPDREYIYRAETNTPGREYIQGGDQYAS